jgi:hypothetical protein
MNYDLLINHLKQFELNIQKDCIADLTGETQRHACGVIPDGVFDEIIGIPDLHSHFHLLLVQLIQVCGLVQMNPDGQLQWTREKVAVVINGDFVDGHRGSIQDRKVKQRRGEWWGEEHYLVVLMNYLDLLARKKKSRLFKLLGNHEMMNLIGKMDHVSQMGLDFYGSESKRKESFTRGEMNAHLRACGTYAVLQIGSVVFVHAGIVPQLIHKTHIHTQEESFVAYANKRLVESLNMDPQDWSQDMSSLFLEPDSLFWTRKYSNVHINPLEIDSQTILEVFRLLGMSEEMQKRAIMCVGHTPQVYRCVADISKGHVSCPSSAYVLSKCIFRDEYKTAWGPPLVRDPKQMSFNNMTFACVKDGHPHLCFMDTAQSSAFDSTLDHRQDRAGKFLMEARRPCVLRISTGGSNGHPHFMVLQSHSNL